MGAGAEGAMEGRAAGRKRRPAGGAASGGWGRRSHGGEGSRRLAVHEIWRWSKVEGDERCYGLS